MLVDGVSDSVSYTQDFWEWGRVAVNDTNKVSYSACPPRRLAQDVSTQTFDGFLQSCADAGPDRCALATPNSTLSSLQARITKLRERLHADPLPVALPSGAGIITASAIQHAVFRGMYSPANWPGLAKALADAEAGDGEKLYTRLNGWDLAEKDPVDNVFGRSMDRLGSGLLCHVSFSDSCLRDHADLYPTQSIMCSDTDPAPMNDTTVETLITYMREMGERSISGEPWSLWVAQCRRWSSHATDVYRGPWTIANGLRKPRYVFLTHLDTRKIT